MFKKFNKIAVLICGELRQHRRAAPFQFEYFKQFSDQVDYFLATWDTTKDFNLSFSPTDELHLVTEDQIVDVFKGQNLKEIYIAKLQDATDYFQKEKTRILSVDHGSFFYRAWLAKKACELKQLEEKNSGAEYDLVAEIRPDLWVKSRWNDRTVTTHYDSNKWKKLQPLGPLADWQIVTSSCPFVVSPDPSILLDDLFFISNSKVNNILCNRLYFVDHECPGHAHRLIYDYLDFHSLFAFDNLYSGEREVIRPNVPENFDVGDRESCEIFEKLREYNEYWRNQMVWGPDFVKHIKPPKEDH